MKVRSGRPKRIDLVTGHPLLDLKGRQDGPLSAEDAYYENGQTPPFPRRRRVVLPIQFLRQQNWEFFFSVRLGLQPSARFRKWIDTSARAGPVRLPSIAAPFTCPLFYLLPASLVPPARAGFSRCRRPADIPRASTKSGPAQAAAESGSDPRRPTQRCFPGVRPFQTPRLRTSIVRIPSLAQPSNNRNLSQDRLGVTPGSLAVEIPHGIHPDVARYDVCIRSSIKKKAT